MIRVKFEPEFESWRTVARGFLADSVPPHDLIWSQAGGEQSGFVFDDNGATVAPPHSESYSPTVVFKVDPEFLKLGPAVACARDEDRWDLLYRTLFRLKFENPDLMKITIDDDVLRIRRMAKNVGRDIHKMHAFVRFKEVEDGITKRFVAWHEPEHRILKLAAPFFVRRFGDRPWSIYTPELSAHWDCHALVYEAGLAKSDFTLRDTMDEVWKTYYRSIFNPARVKIKAMQSEMPIKYWQSLSEAEIIEELIREAPKRLDTLARNQPKAAIVPQVANYDELKLLAKKCTACSLFEGANQTVFGEGPIGAEVAIVGEQPGDTEDLVGRPFVGPAGEVLDRALKLAGLERGSLYLTNAVKHFKFQSNGKTRLHQKPSGTEMHACRPWLEAELALVNPKVVILLGVTAGTSWLGRLPQLTEERGRLLRPRDPNHKQLAVLSWHPAAILRATSEADREKKFTDLVQDLRVAAQACKYPANYE